LEAFSSVDYWTKVNAEFTDADARRAWAEHEVSWGMWAVPDAELGIFGDVSGLDAVELGCGTAFASARLARLGARVVGVDPTPAQLGTARRMQAEFRLDFPLIEAFAEDVPLPDASFDLAQSEYGASLFADPYRWIPEAHRLLRPGGRLVFMRATPLLFLCGHEDGLTEQLQRPLRGMNRIEQPGEADQFMLPHGELFRLLDPKGQPCTLAVLAPPSSGTMAPPITPLSIHPQWRGDDESSRNQRPRSRGLPGYATRPSAGAKSTAG
jgi:SAM-dependent methyltransferase